MRRSMLGRLLAASFAAFAAFALGAAAPAALAQTTDFPARPVRLVVPFPAGGVADSIARTIAPELGKRTGQSIVVDYRSGAGGSIGAAVVAQAPADGYTLLLVLDTHAVNPLVYKNLPYDTAKDFAPITLLTRAPMVLVAHEGFAPNTLAELVRYGKEHPNGINFGSVGAGSASHLTAESFDAATGITATHVPYKGGAPAQTDLMAGQIQVMWNTAPSADTMVKAGKIKALGQAGSTRSVAFPNLPTAAEQGIAGFEAYGWSGLLLPAHTPEAIVRYWHDKVREVLQQPAVAARFKEQGFDVVGSSPAEFAGFIAAEQKKWQQLIATKNIPLQ